MKKDNLWPIVIAAVVVAAFTIPIFKSGGKNSLTLVSFLKNHTIWYDGPYMYVPNEPYMEEAKE